MKYWILVTFIFLQTSSFAQLSKGVRLLSQWDSPYPVQNGSSAKYNDCWAFEWKGEEYAVIGSTIGTHIIHLAKDNETYEVAFIQGSSYGNYIVHRDFEFYNGYVYGVCDQEPGSLQVIDCRNLPESAELVTQTNEFFSTAHNLYLDLFTQKLYVSGPSGNAMSILDVGTDPENPSLLSHFNGVQYVHDCFVQRDTAYLHAGSEGFFIFNFQDTNNPMALGALTSYPEQGYNHSGWLSADGMHYVFTDETPGMRMKIVDVSDLSDMDVVDLFWSGSDPQTMVHNVMIKGNLAYVSHYFDGLEIYNISDPENVIRVAWYDTYTKDNSSGRGAWGIHALLPSGKIIISDRQTGLYVFTLESNTFYPKTPEISIGSNPGNGQIIVNLVEFDFRNAVHRVYNSQGKIVDEGEWNRESSKYLPLDLTNLEDGHYTIEIVLDATRVETAKYIKITP